MSLPKLTKQQIQDALNVITVEAFNALVAVSSSDESLDELTYIKNTAHTPGGGIYLLSILHIDGPKLDLKQFRAVADAVAPTPEDGKVEELAKKRKPRKKKETPENAG